MLLVHGIEPFMERAQAWADMLDDRLEQPRVQAVPELCDGSDRKSVV